MSKVTSEDEILEASKSAIESLYGPEFKDLKLRVVFPFPNEKQRDSWDTQVTFLKDGLQYTVDLMIQESDGVITNARLIDTMKPL
jgi:hypothetical protein